MKHEVFNYELSLITNEKAREFASKSLDFLPDYFYTIPASSTGKYHPSYALGDGGLVRHTKAAVRIARDLFGNETICNFTEKEKDIIIIALLLHDGCKNGSNYSKYTTTTHPLEIIGYIKTNPELMKLVSESTFSMLSSCIASHIGQWNSDYKTKKEVLPKPKTEIEKFVHLCDYLASRKSIEINFNEI